MAQTNADGSIVLTTKIVTDGIDKTLSMIKKKFSQLKEEKSTVNAISEAIKLQKKRIEELNIELAKLTVSGEAYGETFAKEVENLKTEIKEETLVMKELESAAVTLGKKGSKSFSDISKSFKGFGKRLAGIVKSALVFSVLYRVMQSVVKLFNNILMSDEEFKEDWEELKAAFYAAAYPIVNLIVPALKYIVQQARDWAVSIGKVEAALQGISYSEFIDQAEASKEAADNYADMEKSSKKTADNVKKQLASFDDIQILSSGNDNKESTNYFDNLKDYDTSGAKSMLGDVMSAIGGALMALGLILLFHGQIAWGIGFIIAGAVGIAAATLTDESVSQKAKDELSNAMLIVGVVAIILGILLCMATQWGIGIGLVALGASSIVAPIALNWDGIKQQLQTSFGGWLALGGVIAIVLGILLCFTPFLPLGIGLIVLGAGALVAPIVANWDAIKNKVVEIFNAVIDWVKSYGLLVLGILLCLSGGVGFPIGLALIIKWAKDGAENGVPLAETIVDKVKGAWNAVKAFWDRNIAPIFTVQWWLNLGKNCINGLVAGFEGGINGIIKAFESMINWIVDGLNKLSFDIPGWLGGGSFGINLPRASLGRVSIPRLAQGAVIPPNREFLAVLGDQKQGTNIETPLATMVEAFNIALNNRGNDTVKEEHYYLDESEIMRIIYRLAKRGEQAQGDDLLESW